MKTKNIILKLWTCSVTTRHATLSGMVPYIYGPKVCLNLMKIGLTVCYNCNCTHDEKINFDGFTQNGCYGNQPQPFEVVF